MSSNLYRIVEREKRILYEERVEGPSVSIARVGSVGGNLEEGGMASVTVQLDRILGEDVTLNLVGSGEATYGASGDYQVSVGDEACDAVTMGNCQITIPMGSTSIDVMVTAREDRGGEPAEEITLSIVIASAGDTGLMLGSPSSLTLTINEDPPLPTVAVSVLTDLDLSSTIEEGNFSAVNITLSEALAEDVTLNLVGSGVATYGISSGDWHLSIGGVDCASVMGMSCQVTITAGMTLQSGSILIDANTDSDTESIETFTISVEVDSGSANLVQIGNRSSETFTIPAN